MPITTASIREPMPEGALRGALQPDGTVLWYMPGDTLPPDPPPGPPPVPQSMTKRQLYRALLQEGWFGSSITQIDAAINALVDTMPLSIREVARAEFFTSRDYLRTNALLVGAMMAPPLSKTPEQIDDFWRLGNSFAPDGAVHGGGD